MFDLKCRFSHVIINDNLAQAFENKNVVYLLKIGRWAMRQLSNVLNVNVNVKGKSTAFNKEHWITLNIS